MNNSQLAVIIAQARQVKGRRAKANIVVSLTKDGRKNKGLHGGNTRAILETIDFIGSAEYDEIAMHCGISRVDVSKNISRLVSLGYIEKC